MFKRLGRALFAMAIGIALAAAPTAQATAAPVERSITVPCGTGNFSYDMYVFYTLASGHRLSIHRVVMDSTSIFWFSGGKVVRHFSSDGFIQPNTASEASYTYVFYWPAQYHVATSSAKANVDTVAEWRYTQGGVPKTTRVDCRAYLWA
jgi:hypothetical protein